MSFCPYCGRRLQEGETCNCRDLDNNIEKKPDETVNPVVNTEDTSASNNEAGSGYDPVQPAAVAPAKGGIAGKWKIIAAACGIVAAIVLVVLGITSVFGGAYKKISKAAEKTFGEAGYLSKDLQKFKYGGDDYTISLAAEIQDYELNLSMVAEGKDKEISVSLGKGKDEFGAVAQIGKKDVKVKATGVDYNNVLLYDYTSDDKDVLLEMLGETSLKAIDEGLATLYRTTSSASDAKKYRKIISKWLKKADYKKVEKKSIKIDGEKRECPGYSISVDEDLITGLVTEFLETYEKDNPGTIEAMGYDDIEDVIEMVEKELDKVDLDDIETEVYIYKGMLAGVFVDADGQKYALEFNGGDYRLQSFKAYSGKKSDSVTLIEGSGKIKDKKETYTITVPSQYELSYTYDRSNGKFEVTVGQYSYWDSKFSDMVKIKGTIECGRSEVKMTVKSFEMSGMTIGLDKLEMTVSSKASLQKLKGKEFRVDTAEKDELNDEILAIGEAYVDALKDTGIYDLIGTFLR